MKNIAAAMIAALGMVSLCNAVEMGIGVSVRESDKTILIPAKLSNNMVVEGLFFHSRESYDGSGGGAVSSSDTSRSDIGLGFFLLKPVTENIHVYVGPRLILSRSKSYSAGGTWPASESDTKGYSVIPTVGFEYSFISHLSLGAEVGYQYYNQHNKSNSGYSSRNSGFDTVINKLILRMYF